MFCFFKKKKAAILQIWEARLNERPNPANDIGPKTI